MDFKPGCELYARIEVNRFVNQTSNLVAFARKRLLLLRGRCDIPMVVLAAS